MGAIAFFLRVLSPLWMLYILVVITGPSTREPALWMGIAAIVGSWLYVEHVRTGVSFWISPFLYTAPGVIALLMAGTALHVAWKDAKRGSKSDNPGSDDAA